MQQNMEPEEELPKGVILRDFDDFTTLRNQIFDGVKNSMAKSFPVDYGNVRLELHDVDYDDVDDVPVSQQKKMLLENKYITKKLRGTIKLFDKTNDQLLEEKRISLMRVPYLTNRGTFIHGGNEYASIMQSRLLPGVYTRRQANGELETQFNVKPGTGIGFRVGFEPETTQYRVKISQANLHLYSLLKDIGTSDKELEKAWGPEIFRANQMKYDARVFDKAYDRLVSSRQKKADKTREDKVNSLRAAFEAAQIHARVAQKNLPNMFNPKIASEWEARWEGKQAAEKAVDAIPFNPDFEPQQVIENYFDEDNLNKEAATNKEQEDYLAQFGPDYDPEDIQDAYNAIYGHYGPRLASMQKWPEKWIKSDVDPMGWLQWYEQYKAGRRTDDDARQIKRWKSFKARHGSQFKKNPTPRRAFALRNWAIDPLKLVEDEEKRRQLAEAMENYKQKAWRNYNKSNE